MLPQKILKISVLTLAENAFPTFWTHQMFIKVLRSSSNSGNWCCLTIRLFEFTAYLKILDFSDVPRGRGNQLHTGGPPAKLGKLAGLYQHIFCTYAVLIFLTLLSVIKLTMNGR